MKIDTHCVTTQLIRQPRVTQSHRAPCHQLVGTMTMGTFGWRVTNNCFLMAYNHFYCHHTASTVQMAAARHLMTLLSTSSDHDDMNHDHWSHFTWDNYLQISAQLSADHRPPSYSYQRGYTHTSSDSLILNTWIWLWRGG